MLYDFIYIWNGKKILKIRFAVIRDRVCREEELENNGQILQISHYKTIKY